MDNQKGFIKENQKFQKRKCAYENGVIISTFLFFVPILRHSKMPFEPKKLFFSMQSSTKKQDALS